MPGTELSRTGWLFHHDGICPPEVRSDLSHIAIELHLCRKEMCLS